MRNKINQLISALLCLVVLSATVPPEVLHLGLIHQDTDCKPFSKTVFEEKHDHCDIFKIQYIHAALTPSVEIQPLLTDHFELSAELYPGFSSALTSVSSPRAPPLS